MSRSEMLTRLEDLERRYSGSFAPDKVIREMDRLMVALARKEEADEPF